MKATISTEGALPLTTFVQTWTTASREDQEQWFAVMRRRVGALTGQPGFVSMSVHRGDDGKHIAVYAQWRSVTELHAATGSPAAKAGHDELARWGASDGGATYTVAAVFDPSSDGDADGAVPGAQSALVTQARQRWAKRDFHTRFVRVNEVSLHVAESGQGDSVFLLHGYPQSGEIWRFVAPELAGTHRVVIPDLRGMGLSEAAKSGYDLGNVAEDLHQLAVSMGIARVKVVGHDWGAAAGAVYAMRYRDEVTRLAFLESSLAGAGFEALWNFSQRNDAFTFVPFLLMGESDAPGDTTADLMKDRESIYLHHLWTCFTGDKKAAPFAEWTPYVAAMSRPGVSVSSSSYYRAAYDTAEQVRKLIARKLEIPVLAIAGEKGVGGNHEAFVRAFAVTLRGNLILPGAGHFLAEERPKEVAAALKDFLAE
jgi:pimeloyl-ACP methyl ester carboxylesterase/heme-degrading monooxygenase HmoA